jgi:hypothetical protein
MATTERAPEVKSGDVLRATYELKWGPYVFWAHVARGRAEVGFAGEPEPFGYVKPGSPTTGAMWIGEDCIAEYEDLQERRATIVPIVNGRKHPESTAQDEPLAFMFSEAVRRLK